MKAAILFLNNGACMHAPLNYEMRELLLSIRMAKLCHAHEHATEYLLQALNLTPHTNGV